jgi:hypothetical protein
MLTKDIASYLDGLGLATYSETANSTIFDRVVDQPDTMVAILLRPGRQSPGYDNLEESAVQVIVRGEADGSSDAEQLAQDIYNALHGYRHGVFVAGGDYILSVLSPQGGPTNIGSDENDRMMYSLNFSVRWRNSAREV